MMDSCFIDITIEFLAVAFHSILHHASVYPASIFEKKKKYNIVVHRSNHPEVNQYIELCLKNIAECLKLDQLHRVEFIVTNNAYEPLVSFVFDFEKMDNYDETTDAYLIRAEQNMRAFCLKLASTNYGQKELPEDTSFVIYLHTNESAAMSITTNPALEDFPMVEIDDVVFNCDKILPMKRFCIRNYQIDSYVELK